MKNWQPGTLSTFVDEFIVPQRDKPKEFSGDTPWCRIEDFNGIYLSSSKSGQFVSDETIKEMGLKVYPVNTVIVSCSADLGRCAIISRPLVTNQTFIGLVPSERISPLFLYHYMSSIAKELNEMSSGATIKYLSEKKFQGLEVCIPTLPEQQRIVTILDVAFAVITKAKANVEQNIKNSKELFESYLQSVFENKGENWEQKTLGEICNLIGGGTPSKSNKKFYGGDIHWATVRDMKGETIKNTEHTITKDAVKNSSTNIIPKGNVIIATRVGLGKVCLIENNTAINQDLRGVVPINPKKLSVDFLYRWLKSIAHKIVEEGTGATVQGVKLPFVKSLVIFFPPLKEQQVIVSKLNALSEETKKLETIYQQKINALEELEKSVLQKAFNGELKTSKAIAA